MGDYVGPCMDRTFVSRYLYRCLGDFMQAAYEAKINQKRPNKVKMCSLFESGFHCFETQIQKEFDVECTPHEIYDNARWFKEEIYNDFSVDVRQCPYPAEPPPTQPTVPSSTKPGFLPVSETPETALVAGFVLGGAVIFILSMLVFIICKRRVGCERGNQHQTKPTIKRASVNLSAGSGSACVLNSNENKMMSNPVYPQYQVNMVDTRSSLTGVSSEGSGYLNPPIYEQQLARPQSSHIYSEITEETPCLEGQRIAPMGCSTVISSSAPPVNMYLNNQDVHTTSVPCGFTVEYLQSGGYAAHAQSLEYVSFNTDYPLPVRPEAMR